MNKICRVTKTVDKFSNIEETCKLSIGDYKRTVRRVVKAGKDRREREND